MLSVVLLSAIIVAPLATNNEASASGQSLQEAFIKGNSEFAMQSYRELSAKGGNVFFSPFSISSALGMVYAGARGNTANEIAAAFISIQAKPNCLPHSRT